jgi:hypothetical protein
VIGGKRRKPVCQVRSSLYDKWRELTQLRHLRAYEYIYERK